MTARSLLSALTTALVLLGGAAPAVARPAAPLRTRLTLAPPRVDVARVRLDGFRAAWTPGQPALPERELTVALHPRADLATLVVEVGAGPTDSLAVGRVLPPNPPLRLATPRGIREHWAGAGTVLAGRDLEAYGEHVFPTQVVERQRVSNRRGLLVLHLRYAPLRYRHATGELLLEKHSEVRVRYALHGGPGFAPDAQLLPHLGQVENPDAARGWYGAARADTTQKLGYAIVITDALAAASAQLAAFVKHKESLGYAVTVVKDADRAAIAIGPKDGDAERIRGWLVKNYKALNLRYVLLVGNPDPRRPGVPMKMTYPLKHDASTDEKVAPTDYYYADLTSNWDKNGDGDFAVYPEDGGDGGLDFSPEVYVGRIPIYGDNVKVLDKILQKTIAYVTEKGDRSWRQRVLQPAAMLFFKNQYNQSSQFRMDGADVADPIFKQAIEPHGLTRTTLYETAGVDPSKFKGDLPLTPENVVKEWQKGYGLVTMVGHGSSDGIFRTVWTKDTNNNAIPDYNEIDSPPYLTYDDVQQLNDARPAFVFHNSCSNGTPEDANNLGFGLLRNGAIGTVSSSRVAYVVLDNSIFNLARDAISLLLQPKPIGEALLLAKEQLPAGKGEAIGWYTRLETNLYGDPSLMLTQCGKDADCDDGRSCTGKETCQAGMCVAGTPVKCTSADPCMESSCVEPGGTCETTKRPTGETCDDGKFCTVNDVCDAGGTCVGEARCAAPNNPCVTGACNEAQQTCDVAATLEGQTCHAGTSRAGQCQRGICEPPASGCAVGRGGPLAAGDGALAALLLLAAVLGRAARRGRRRS